MRQAVADRLHRAMTLVAVAVDEGGGKLKEAVVNAGILAGLAFFSTLAGLGATGLLADPIKGLTSACIAAGVTFFTRLALERGLPPETG